MAACAGIVRTSGSRCWAWLKTWKSYLKSCFRRRTPRPAAVAAAPQQSVEKLQALTPEVLDNILSRIDAEIEHLGPKGSTFNFSSLISNWEQRKATLTNFKKSIPQELTNEVPRQSKDVIMPLVQTTLGGVGTMHWQGLGCLFIAWSLENIHQTSQNDEDILHVLRRIVDLLKDTRKIWEMNRDADIQELQDIVEKAFRCALICTSDLNDAYVLRFLKALTIKDAIFRLKEELNAKELPRSLSSYIWENSSDLLAEVWTTTFIKGVKEGNMDPNFYGAFIMQDAVWCRNMSKVWECIAENASVPQELRDISAHKKKSYLKAAHELFGKFDVKDDGVNIRHVATQYVDTVQYVITQYGAPYIMIATYACSKLWSVITEELKNVVNSSNPYNVWVSDNLGTSSTSRQASKIDEWDQKHQWYDWKLALSIFQQAMRHEIDLFNFANRVTHD